MNLQRKQQLGFFSLSLRVSSLSLFSGSGRNTRACEVNVACFRNHGDHALHLLCMGLIPTGIIGIKVIYFSHCSAAAKMMFLFFYGKSYNVIVYM